MRDCTNTVLYWLPASGDVALAPLGVKRVSLLGYRMSLACYAEFREATFEERKARLFIEFAHIVVRDGVDPVKLHELLLNLEEWRDGCAHDMPGIARRLGQICPQVTERKLPTCYAELGRKVY